MAAAQQQSASKTSASHIPFSSIPDDVKKTLTAQQCTLDITHKEGTNEWRIKVASGKDTHTNSSNKALLIESIIKILGGEPKDSPVIVTVNCEAIVFVKKDLTSALCELKDELTKESIKCYKINSNGIPNTNNQEIIDAYKVIEKIEVCSDPLTSEPIYAYRFWEEKGVAPHSIPIYVNALKGCLFCSITDDLEAAKKKSIGAKDGKVPEVINLAKRREKPTEVPSVKELRGKPLGEVSAPKAVSRPNTEETSKQEKESKLKSLHEELKSSHEKLELQLSSFGDKPKYEKHSLTYTNSAGEVVTVERKTFTHPEDPSVSVFGYPFIKKENDEFYLAYAVSPSERDAHRTPMSVFEGIIRENINNNRAQEKIRAEIAARQAQLFETAKQNAREHTEQKTVLLSFEAIASLKGVPTNNSDYSFAIDDTIYSMVLLQIGEFQFQQIPYLYVIHTEDGFSALEVRYGLEGEIPEIDEGGVLKAIEDAKGHIQRTHREKILSELHESGEPIAVSLLHVSHQPKIDEQTGELVVTHPNQKQGIFSPKEFSYGEEKIIGYPYIEFNSGVFSLKYAESKEKASENMLAASLYQKLLLEAATEEVSKEKQFTIPSDVVFGMQNIMRGKDGSLSIENCSPLEAKRRGLSFTLYPSLRVSEDGNLICFYTDKASMMTDEQNSIAVEAARSSLRMINDTEILKHSRKITIDLSHTNSYRTINEQGVLTYVDASGKEMKCKPQMMDINGRPIKGFPYIFAKNGIIEIRFALTLSSAMKAHMQKGHLINLIRDDILRGLPDDFFTRAALIDPIEVEQMIFPERDKDGSLRIGRAKKINTKTIDERGVQIVLWPSIIFKERTLEGPSRLGIVYTPRAGKKELSEDKFKMALEQARKDVSELRAEGEELVFTPVEEKIENATKPLGVANKPKPISSMPSPDLNSLLLGTYSREFSQLFDLCTFSDSTSESSQVQELLLNLLSFESELFKFYKASFEVPATALHTVGTEERFIHSLSAPSPWKNLEQAVRAYLAEAMISYAHDCLGFKSNPRSEALLEKTKVTEGLSESTHLEIKNFFLNVKDLLVKIRKSSSLA